MKRQLTLIDTDAPASGQWRLDERTRELGRRRVQEAREVLRQANRRADHSAAQEASHHTAA